MIPALSPARPSAELREAISPAPRAESTVHATTSAFGGALLLEHAGVPLTDAEATTARFLATILPSEGVYFIVTPAPYKHHSCASIEAAARLAVRLNGQGETVYFATAAYKVPYVEVLQSDGKRKRQYRIHSNVRALRALFLDIDVKHGNPNAYASLDEAEDALGDFCEEVRLPLPHVVRSGGGGLHVYWPFCTSVSVDQWAIAASGLKSLCVKLGFKADPSRTTDQSSILRPVGTTHRKDPANPRTVDLVVEGAVTPYEQIAGLLEQACRLHGATVSPRPLPETRNGGDDNQLNAGFGVQQDYPPFSARAVAERCQQLARMRDTRGNISEPAWYTSIQLMNRAVEGPELIHAWSNGYVGYSAAETDEKIAQVKGMGPPLCATLESRNSGGCDNCPFKGKISTPAQLGTGTVGSEHSTAPTVADQPPADPVANRDGALLIVPGACGDGRAPAKLRNGTADADLVIILPNDHYTFPQSAQTIFPRLAATFRYFVRGNEMVALTQSKQGQSLTPVSPDEFRALVDGLNCPVKAYIKPDGGGLALKDKRCARESAVTFLATREICALLPRLELVSRSAVLAVRGGQPVVLGPGYHPDAGGVLVTATKTLPQVAATDAVDALLDLLTDYDFATASDKSRAIASLITPALRMGRLLFEDPDTAARYPISVIEANASQTGKGHLQQLTCAVYGERACLIAKKTGGVGSLDESIGNALLSGNPFVSLDNVRGRLDSQYLEMILTCDSYAPARVPHRGEVSVDVRAVQFQMTSNGVDVTEDLANRCSIVRLRKRPAGYQFRTWPGGLDVLSHIKRYQEFYLACVFAVLASWLSADRPQRHGGGHHDFREWAGAMGWIVEEVFRGAPLLTGHKAAQERVSNPALTWLRAVCLAAESANHLDYEMSASAVAELCGDAGIDMPGLESTADGGQAHKHVGKLFARCFPDRTGPSTVEIDDFTVVRREDHERNAQRQAATIKRYRILRSVRTDPTTS